MRKITVEITIADDGTATARALPPPPPPPPLPAMKKPAPHVGISHASHRKPEPTVLRHCEARLCDRAFVILACKKTGPTRQRFCRECQAIREKQQSYARQRRFRARKGR